MLKEKSSAAYQGFIFFYERFFRSENDISLANADFVIIDPTIENNGKDKRIEYNFHFVNKEDEIRYQNFLADVLSSNEKQFQYDIKLKSSNSGKIISFKDYGIILETYNGNAPKKIVGVLVNLDEIKNLKEKYAQLEEEYDFLANNVEDVVWVLDISTMKFSYVSPSIQKLRGLTQDEAIAETLSDALTPTSYKMALKILNEKLEAIKKGNAEENFYVGIFEQKRKDGEVRNIEIMAKFILDEEGNPYKVLGVSRDVTKNVLRHSQMKENLDKFKTIFDMLNSGLILTDMDGKIIDFNQFAKKIFSLKEEDRDNIELFNLFNRIDLRIGNENIKSILSFNGLIQYGYGYNFECELKRDGKIYFLEINIKPLRFGIYGALLTINDITQRINFEKYLKRNLILERLVAFLAGEFLTAINAQKAFQKTAEILKLNLEVDRIYIAEARLNSDRNIYEFKIILDLTSNDYLSPFLFNDSFEGLYLNDILKKEIGKNSIPITLSSFPLEFRTAAIARGYKTVLLFPIFFQEALYGFLGLENYDEEKIFEFEQINILRVIAKMLSDFLDRKNFEESLQKAKKTAEEASLAKSIFLAKISHELRTPLNGIIGMSELAYNAALDNSQREYINAIKNSANSLLELLNDILDMSKIEAGKMELIMEEFNIYDLLDKTIELLTVAANQKGIELLLDVDYSLPEKFIGDSVRLKQVLVNLLSNAIKFTEEGEVKALVKLESLNKAKKEAKILFAVEDTGIGIEADKLKTIFDSFSQADSSKARKYGGAGLGLAISKSLVEMMGGELKVESELGKGSKFYFSIILPYENLSFLSFDLKNLQIKKALIIDDNENARKIFGELLRKFNIESDTSDSGIDGIQKISMSIKSEDKYDAIFLDHQMPYMDGIITAENIRNYLKLKDLPIVMMFSSDKIETLKERCLELNILYYLNKPCKYHDVRRILLDLSGEKSDEEKQNQQKFEKIGLRFEDKTILVAEDNSINMMIAVKMLSNVGAQILQAKDGVEAYEMAMKRKIDLIFMDVNMPNMDGFQATRKIREMEKNGEHVPIIAVTANAMRGDREECLAAGMDDYISKPFKMEEIYRVLMKFFKNVDNPNLEETQDLFLKETLECALFDRAAFMSRLANDKEFALQVIDEIEKTLPSRVEELNNAFLEKDYDKLARSSHSIKGVAAYLSSERIRSLSEKIERMAKNKEDISAMLNYFEFLKANIKDLLGEIAKLKFKLKNS